MAHETCKAHLSSPDTLNSLGQTDIIRLELVQTDAGSDGSDVEEPEAGLVGSREATAGHVVDDDGLHARVAVDEQETAENGVEGGVERAAGERGHGQRNKTSGDQALECPVVGAVAGLRIGDGDRVVYCSTSSLESVIYAQHQARVVAWRANSNTWAQGFDHFLGDNLSTK